MNGNVSLHGARKWFASGAYALQGVPKSPELARRTDCWLQGIPKDSPPPPESRPCFLRSSCGSAWLFHFARLLQTSPVNKLPCHPGRLPASLWCSCFLPHTSSSLLRASLHSIISLFSFVFITLSIIFPWSLPQASLPLAVPALGSLPLNSNICSCTVLLQCPCGSKCESQEQDHL